jgi:hypothetical protein
VRPPDLRVAMADVWPARVTASSARTRLNLFVKAPLRFSLPKSGRALKARVSMMSAELTVRRAESSA